MQLVTMRALGTPLPTNELQAAGGRDTGEEEGGGGGTEEELILE